MLVYQRVPTCTIYKAFFLGLNFMEYPPPKYGLFVPQKGIAQPKAFQPLISFELSDGLGPWTLRTHQNWIQHVKGNAK